MDASIGLAEACESVGAYHSRLTLLSRTAPNTVFLPLSRSITITIQSPQPFRADWVRRRNGGVFPSPPITTLVSSGVHCGVKPSVKPPHRLATLRRFCQGRRVGKERLGANRQKSPVIMGFWKPMYYRRQCTTKMSSSTKNGSIRSPFYDALDYS